MSKEIILGKRKIAEKEPCFIIGEVAQGHDGSLGIAHAYIDAIADVGADAVKFQTHIADAESTLEESWRIPFSFQDKNRYDYWKRMEFTSEQWIELKRHSEDRKLIFLSSPFSIEAAEMLYKMEITAWKIASGEVNNFLLLDYIKSTRLPCLVSTGMSSLARVDEIIKDLKAKKIEYGIFQCTTSYPCPPEKIGLNMLEYFSGRYGCPVGLSDHSGCIYPGLSAVSLGCQMLEVHVTFSKKMFGPDTTASLTVEQLGQIVEGIRYIEKMKDNPIDKNIFSKKAEGLSKMFSRSIALKHSLPAGTVLTEKYLTLKKPGTGIAPDRFKEIIGCRLRRDVHYNVLLTEEDLEEER